MGFGFLLYGYLMIIEMGIRVSLSPAIGFDVFPDLLGYIFFYLALRKLSPYARGFSQAKALCFLLFPAGAVTLLGQTLAWIGIGMSFVPALLEYAKLGSNLLLLFFHAALLSGIAKLSADVELPRLSVKAKMGLGMSVFCYFTGVLLQLSEKLIPDLLAKYAGIHAYIGLLYQLLFYLVFFFNLYVIFSAYRQICYEGEEDSDGGFNPLEWLYKRFKGKNGNDL